MTNEPRLETYRIACPACGRLIVRRVPASQVDTFRWQDYDCQFCGARLSGEPRATAVSLRSSETPRAAPPKFSTRIRILFLGLAGLVLLGSVLIIFALPDNLCQPDEDPYCDAVIITAALVWYMSAFVVAATFVGLAAKGDWSGAPIGCGVGCSVVVALLLLPVVLALLVGII